MKKYLYLLLSLSFTPLCSAQFNTLRQGEVVASITEGKPSESGEETPSTGGDEAVEQSSLPARVRKVFVPILEPLQITSPFGYRIDPIDGKRRWHGGVDLRCKHAKVYSMLTGKVKKVGHKGDLGNYVVLKHGPFEVTYGHLEFVLVEKGDEVSPGNLVAVSGNTGRSTGPHLHLSLKYRGRVRNPLPLLSLIEETYSIQTKLNHHIAMGKTDKYLTALEHVQENYQEDYSLWLKKNKLTASEETALRFLAGVEIILDTSSEKIL